VKPRKSPDFVDADATSMQSITLSKMFRSVHLIAAVGVTYTARTGQVIFQVAGIFCTSLDGWRLG